MHNSIKILADDLELHLLKSHSLIFFLLLLALILDIKKLLVGVLKNALRCPSTPCHKTYRSNSVSLYPTVLPSCPFLNMLVFYTEAAPALH